MNKQDFGWLGNCFARALTVVKGSSVREADYPKVIRLITERYSRIRRDPKKHNERAIVIDMIVWIDRVWGRGNQALINEAVKAFYGHK